MISMKELPELSRVARLVLSRLAVLASAWAPVGRHRTFPEHATATMVDDVFLLHVTVDTPHGRTHARTPHFAARSLSRGCSHFNVFLRDDTCRGDPSYPQPLARELNLRGLQASRGALALNRANLGTVVCARVAAGFPRDS